MMKVFETIHLIILLSFVIGVPIAATTHCANEPFSTLQGLKQAGIATAVLIALFVLNFAARRAYWRLMARGRSDP
mgnify:CR=1 FL=1